MTLTDAQIAALGAKIIVRPPPDAAKPSELTLLLTEMKRFSAAVVSLAEKEDAPQAMLPQPIVTVAAPNVQVAAPILPIVPRRWRFTVTRRDNTAQQRIQEIVIEPLE